MSAKWFDLEIAWLRIARRGGRMVAGVWTVAVASAAVFFILALGNGLEAYLSERLQAFTPALWVEGAPPGANLADVSPTLASFDGIGAVSKTVEATIIASRSNKSAGARLAGYEPEALRRVLPIPDHSVTGRLPLAKDEAAFGADLARALGLRPGDAVQLTGPSGRTATVHVVGILHAGFSAVDAALALTTFDAASELVGAGGQYGYAVEIAEGVNLEALRQKLQAATGRWTQTWYEGRQALLEAVEVQSRVMFWISLAAVAAAALGSSGVAALKAAERKAETGILLALGASRANLLRAALAESILSASAAAIIGAGIGMAAALALRHRPLELPAAFGLEHLPLQPSWTDFLLAAGLTVLASCLAAIMPALRAANADPAASLRQR